jgi:gliding motility-associated-like protein
MERISRRGLNISIIIKKLYHTAFLLLLSACFTPLQAQKRFHSWHFGNRAGITFNTSPPSPLTGSTMYQLKGCASISDKNTGNLLFYTNGVNVYNRFHQVMPNGSGLNGHNASGQSALIVPKPGDSSLYYIFTADAGKYAGQGTKGIHFSVVDMNMDGGKGDLFIKNVSLLFPASELLTAVRHCNGEDYWIIAHSLGSSSFKAWLLGRTGFPGTTVSTAIGTPWSLNPEMATGQLKVAPDGHTVAAAVKGLNVLQIFNFDNGSGLFKGVLTIPKDTIEYGLEFSPDSKKLYLSTSVFSVPYLSQLYQYDLSSGTIPGIASSKILLHSTNVVNGASTDIFGGMQSGPDGKIYIARSNADSLGVIDNPNVAGAGCSYRHAGLYLGGNTSTLGLPNLINNELFNPGPIAKLELGNDTSICGGDSLLLDATMPSAVSYTWSTGDTVAAIQIKSTGKYMVNVDIGACRVSDSVSVYVRSPQVSLGNDTPFCAGGSLSLDAGIPGATYLWSTGETTRQIDTKGLGAFWVRVTEDGCSAFDTIELTQAPDSFQLIIPNVFTPGNDGLNNLFEITATDPAVYELSIYNRWAQQVFESKSPLFSWDGTLGAGSAEAAQGTYYYVLKYRSNCSEKELVRHGTVTLLRE